MDRFTFNKIINSPKEHNFTGECPVLSGLIIVHEYIRGAGVTGVREGKIYSVLASELIEAGIDELDVIQLRDCGWFLSSTGRLQIYV